MELIKKTYYIDEHTQYTFYLLCCALCWVAGAYLRVRLPEPAGQPRHQDLGEGLQEEDRLPVSQQEKQDGSQEEICK